MTAQARLQVLDRALLIDIRDDGSCTAPWCPGAGLTSMRERVAQLGGTLTVRHDGRPSRVAAALPLSGALT